MGGTSDGASGGPRVGSIRQLSERKPVDEVPSIDIDAMTKKFEEELLAGITEAFENVLRGFCSEVIDQAAAFTSIDATDLQEIMAKSRDQIPAIVEKALTED